MRRMVKQKIAVYCVSFVIGLLIFYYITKRDVNWDNLAPSEDFERSHRDVSKHDKWIVLTTIQHPTYQVKQLAKIPGWKLVVVGDRKSPQNWNLPGAIYLDTAAQKELQYRTHKFLPYDSYTRKAIGYLYAIEHGATYIYETDDDNDPIDGLGLFDSDHTSPIGAVVAESKKNVSFNPYPHFGQSSLWPRGYPLEHIGNDQPRIYRSCSSGIVPAIQQGLVNGDPDVDAIFRLTRKHSGVALELTFDGAAPPVVLPKGVFAPYNSQNTLVTLRAFWSLILPTSVKVRACDIYRSYWAQRLLWLIGSRLAFYPPTSLQRRNPHSSIVDATEEAELYQNMGRYVKFLSEWKCTNVFFFDCGRKLTEDLVVLGFLGRQDLDLIDAWFTDLATIGYIPPPLKQHPEICSSTSENEFLFYPWEQKTSMFYVQQQSLQLPVLDWNQMNNTNTVAKYCGGTTAFCSSKVTNYESGENILLIVSIHNTGVIPLVDAAYRSYFPNIIYCGQRTELKALERSHKISYVSPIGAVNAANCLTRAVRLRYHVQGYLHVSSSAFLQPRSVPSRNRNQVWAMADPQVYKPHILDQCNDQSFFCSSLTLKKLANLEKGLDKLDLGSSQKQRIKQCFTKISLDENLKHNTGVKYLRDPAFFLPTRLVASFEHLTNLINVGTSDSQYSFLVFLLQQCMELVTEFLHTGDVQDTEKDNRDVIVPFDFESMTSKKDVQKVYCDHFQNMCN